MGGRGSGRRSTYDAKDTTEGARPLDIRKLMRSGLLTPGRTFGWQWTLNDRPVANIQIRVELERVVLLYRHRSHREAEWQEVEQAIDLEHTPCNIGGTRCWWLCPRCRRRVAIFYGSGKLYACRHCYQLGYACQKEGRSDRSARRADTIRRKLGWDAGILNGGGGKPKGMRWRTFERLTREHDLHANAALAGMAKFFGLLGKVDV
jgi:hypothetical protein